MYATAVAARNAARDLTGSLRQGDVPEIATLRFAAAVDQFLSAARSGVALNKWGKPYKVDAIADLESCLRGHVVPALGTELFAEVRRGHVQRLVDRLMATAPQKGKLRDRSAERLSGSRIRSIVNAIRSLYRWGILRDLAEVDPAQLVQLPAVDERPRVDTALRPPEMVRRLALLPLTRQRGGRYRARPLVITPGERLPFALATYAGARRAEIRSIAIEDVDLVNDWIFLGVDENGRKTASALRGIPLLPRLKVIIMETLMEAGRGHAHPKELLCPGDRVRGRNSGMLSFEALIERADRVFEDAGLERVTPHQCRHHFISWLDAAGVRPVVASKLAGHTTSRQNTADGAALVTQRVYTHPLAGELREAMQLLQHFIENDLKDKELATA